jgi:hypothetical protein
MNSNSFLNVRTLLLRKKKKNDQVLAKKLS